MFYILDRFNENKVVGKAKTIDGARRSVSRRNAEWGQKQEASVYGSRRYTCDTLNTEDE